METEPQHLVADSLTLRGPDGRQTIVNAFGSETTGPRSKACLKSFIDDDGIPTVLMVGGGKRIGLFGSDPPMLIVGEGADMVAVMPHAIAVRDGQTEAHVTAKNLGYIAKLGRDGLIVLPFTKRPSLAIQLLEWLRDKIQRRLDRRAVANADDLPGGPRIFHGA